MARIKKKNPGKPGFREALRRARRACGKPKASEGDQR
jgi:hypothetical protein